MKRRRDSIHSGVTLFDDNKKCNNLNLNHKVILYTIYAMFFSVANAVAITNVQVLSSSDA